MEIKYSKEQFEGYTHRFIIQFEVTELSYSNLTLFSNSDNYQKLEDFINEKKTEKVLSFKIIHRASKEQDEMDSKFINETLKDL